jgi:hypothetical protein
MLAGSFLAGSVLLPFRREAPRWIVTVCCGLLIITFGRMHARSAKIFQRSEDFGSPAHVAKLTHHYMSGEYLNNLYSYYLPVGVEEMPEHPAQKKWAGPETVRILDESVRSDRYRFKVNAEQASEAVINTFYFPGWRAWIDGEEAELAAEPKTGRMTFSVPQGEHGVTLRFGDTPLRRWAKILSAACFAMGAMLFLLRKRVFALDRSGQQGDQ